jgi:hypothetical protein
MTNPTTKTTEQIARERVANTPELKKVSDTIFADWPNWDEHLEWVTSAPVAEILDWVESMK